VGIDPLDYGTYPLERPSHWHL